MRSRDFSGLEEPTTPTRWLYQDDRTSVTATLVTIDGRCYPVAAIGAFYIAKPNVWGFMVAALALLVGAAALYRGAASQGATLTCLVFAGILALAGLFQPAALIVRTHSADQHVVRSIRSGQLRKIMGAIAQAIETRG